jgi:DtxR family Mn-dependent transcriptional regulator
MLCCVLQHDSAVSDTYPSEQTIMPGILRNPPRSASRAISGNPRAKAQKGSESVDDYLKAIFALGGAEGRRVGSTALAERLQVAPASITNMLQKLARTTNPLVEYERHRGVRLSASGRRRALEIVRHHRLIETFLHRVLDYEVDELHDEAERLEHFISERFEARIDAKLGHPERDPHGCCIPALDGTMPAGHRVSCNCPE